MTTAETPASQSMVTPQPAAADIDASCRLPLFVMFVSAAIWLLIGSVFGFISTLKFHNPNSLADYGWLTYGRTHPAAQNSALYGFCLQAGLGVGLWIIARLGRTLLAHRWMVTIGAMLWNLGVTVGVLGILAGDGTGFENLDMPHYGARIIFLGYLLFGVWAVFTFHQRRERALFVSQWFILAALFWFPWIYSTGYLLLVAFPVRGVAQAVIAWWFSNNLQVVWLGLIGLAAVFYFFPKLAQTELHSRYLALLTFWTLILFGGWGGIPNTAPVPAWMPALSTTATVWMLVPILAAALNAFATLRGKCDALKVIVPLQFIWLGMIGFILAGLMNIAAVLPPVSQVTQFTWFTAARAQATAYGFFSLVMFGAIYHIFPQLAGIEFTSPKLVRIHLWVAAAGLVLIIVPLAVGGLLQGFKLQDPAIDFPRISRLTLAFLRASTMGDVLIFAGHVLFAVNVIGVVRRFSRARVVAAYTTATASLFNPEGAR